MNKIGMIGSKTFNDQYKISKIFKNIKNTFGKYAVIYTGGNDHGVEAICKKYALELDLEFKEFNPSYTGHRLYSAMPEEYYGKGYHFSHLLDRYKNLVMSSDYIICFQEENIQMTSDLKYAISFAKKNNKKIIIIN